MKKVITYGTFDLFHIGHLNLLKAAKTLGDYLIVAVSTDEFNAGKEKKSIIPFEHRMEIINNIKCVDMVIKEENWEQKKDDIQKHSIDTFVMGNDWQGKFDYLNQFCSVKYIQRTENISTTFLKKSMDSLGSISKEELLNAFDILEVLKNELS